MARIPINLGGGGGGASSDECTATAEDVLESKTAVYNGSGDEAAYGSMKDYSGITTAATSSLDSSNSRVQFTVPNTGKYDTLAKLYDTYSSIASLIGLTAAKIATGNSILGISGSYTGLGDATAAQVLSGKTFSTASLSNASGTMTDKSGTTTSATSSLDSSNSRFRLKIPTAGYYDTSAYLYDTYSNVASLISLTAAKIATGNTILGIAGTYTGLGDATAANVLSGKTFSTASLSNASGTMTDKSGTTTSATSSTNSSNVRLQIPANGYYNTSAYLYASYSNIASLIGLTAAKLASGNTVLGIAGTANELQTITDSDQKATMSSSTYQWKMDGTYSYYDLYSFTLEDIGFTPIYGYIYSSSYCTILNNTGCNIFYRYNSRPTGFYTSSDNSRMSMTSDKLCLPSYSNTYSAYCFWGY